MRKESCQWSRQVRCGQKGGRTVCLNCCILTIGARLDLPDVLCAACPAGIGRLACENLDVVAGAFALQTFELC
jgi:hypothetical protein